MIRPANRKNQDRQVAAATWAGAVSAFMSFLATLGLIYLAARQESATYRSALYSKQIDSLGALISAYNVAIARAVLGESAYSFRDLQKAVGEYQTFVGTETSASASFSAIVPDMLAKDVAVIERDLNKILMEIAIENGKGNIDEVKQHANNITTYISEATTTKDEMFLCCQKILKEGGPILDISTCDLSKSKNARDSLGVESNFLFQ